MSLLKALSALLILASGLAFAIPEGVHILNRDPSHISDEELQVWGDEIPDSGILSISESIHGSEKYLKLMARLMRYSIENKGYRLILWENGATRSLELNDWLKTCRTTKSPAPIDALYMPTEADLSFFTYLCDWNLTHPQDPVTYRGMDIWDRPWEHYNSLKTILSELHLSYQNELSNIESHCQVPHMKSWKDLSPWWAEAQANGIWMKDESFTSLKESLQKIDQALSSQTNRKAWQARIHLSTFQGWVSFYQERIGKKPAPHWWNERDMAQARNSHFIFKQEGVKKALLISHTSHASQGGSETDWWGLGDIKSGVYFLKNLHGFKVKNFAVTGYKVSGTQGVFALPTAANSVDHLLFNEGVDVGFFTSTAPFLKSFDHWWINNENEEPFTNGVLLKLEDHFDGYFFIKKSLLGPKIEPWRNIWEP